MYLWRNDGGRQKVENVNVFEWQCIAIVSNDYIDEDDDVGYSTGNVKLTKDEDGYLSRLMRLFCAGRLIQESKRGLFYSYN